MKSTIHNGVDVYDGEAFRMPKKADTNYMYGSENGNGNSTLRMYHAQFMIYEWRITEILSGYIVNWVK